MYLEKGALHRLKATWSDIKATVTCHDLKGCRGLSTSSWDGQHVFLFAVSLYVSKQHLHQRGITIQHKVLSGVVAIDNDSKVPQLLINTGSTEKCITCMLHTAEGFEGLHSLEMSSKKLQNLQYQSLFQLQCMQSQWSLQSTEVHGVWSTLLRFLLWFSVLCHILWF